MKWLKVVPNINSKSLPVPVTKTGNLTLTSTTLKRLKNDARFYTSLKPDLSTISAEKTDCIRSDKNRNNETTHTPLLQLKLNDAEVYH